LFAKICLGVSFAIDPPVILRFSGFVNDSDSTIPLLLVVLVLLLLLVFCIFLIVIRISARLRRLELILLESSSSSGESIVIKRETPREEATEYEEFLREDAARRLLSKRDQSAAFREWRRKRGKTWSATGQDS
jgi:hypothetical protein